MCTINGMTFRAPLCIFLFWFVIGSNWIFTVSTNSCSVPCFYCIKGIVNFFYTRVGTLIVATIYLQLTQNRYMFRSFTVLHCSHQHCVQPVASDVEVVGYL